MFPPRFVANVTGVWGDAGRAWLAALPDLLAECAAAWQLTLLPPFDLSYNYVAPARRSGGSEVVLKLGVPNPELTAEIEALRLYGGQAAARLYEADAEQGILLLERVSPGTPLALLQDDDAATEIAAGVMRALWRPLPAGHAFPGLTPWMAALVDDERRARVAARLPRPMLDAAAALARDLITSQDRPVLLHGDLHHWNILGATRAPWLAIDPKGVAGEPAYEPAALLRNPLPRVLGWTDLRRVTEQRIAQLSELLSFDRQRLAAWNWVQAVLSACWDVEDQDEGIDEFMVLVDVAEAVYRAI